MSSAVVLQPEASDCSATRARAPSLLEEARSRALYLRTYAANGCVPIIDASAAVHPTAVLIGDVRIGPDCWIGPNASIRADQGRIEIGARTSIQDNCVLHTGPDAVLSIDAEGQIGHGAMLHGCTIGRNVLIGMGAIVMDDVVVEHDVIVAAATLVPGKARVPTGMLFVGSPGKVVRPLTEADMAGKRECTEQYVALARGAVGMSWAPAHIVSTGSNNR
jgi:carbonic anhydrase/acetyltransferase-like protein (isoleucine patch superfamily)